LGKKFCRKFKLEVTTPAEAVRALCYLIQGFEEELKKGAYRVTRFSERTSETIDETVLNFKLGSSIGLKIEPVIAGNKRGGLGKIILGIVLVGAAFFFSGGALAGTAFSVFGAPVSYAQIALIGGLMAIQGATAMLAPKTADKTDNKEEPTSFLISSPQNQIEQGHPVPIVYGECIVGSVMVSAGISIEEFTA
jgi:predicted phage tail protein